ncbi:MAG: NAD-dependent epimerase/dehydratase family protein [Chloroflexi bacterium]|nr:NAD-dependent epimerase/dehydratase family protein [Chloroflexota bacterium]
MRILITGGAGFIGSHLAEALITAGDQIVVVDDLSRGVRENVPPEATFEQLDLAAASLEPILERYRPEVVVHCAARASVEHSMRFPLEDYRVNQLGAFRLFEACARQGVQHVVLLSTSAVYGQAERPARETDLPAPANYYGIHKWAAERYLELSGLFGTILRLANVYGPRQRSDGEGGAVAIFLDRILAGEEVVLYGGGEQTRDYIYVTDVVAAITTAIRYRLAGVWNVGSGQETPIRVILDTVATAAGRSPRVRTVPPRAGDVLRSSLDASKLIATGLWKPTVALEVGIQQTVQARRDARDRI